MYQTDMYEGMLAETIMIQGYHGESDQRLFCPPAGSGAVSGDGAGPPYARLG